MVQFGSTPLMVAAEFGSVDAAKMLLAKGADVNRHNSVSVCARNAYSVCGTLLLDLAYTQPLLSLG